MKIKIKLQEHKHIHWEGVQLGTKYIADLEIQQRGNRDPLKALEVNNRNFRIVITECVWHAVHT